MCGRFTQTITKKKYLAALGKIELPPLFGGRYNIAPTQAVCARTTETPKGIEQITWGFTHPDYSTPVINARIETLHEKPLFKSLVRAQRCLIFSDGFYEWKAKVPWYFHHPNQHLFAFAGLWRSATPQGKKECVIITRTASTVVAPIHHRMPLILQPEQWHT